MVNNIRAKKAFGKLLNVVWRMMRILWTDKLTNEEVLQRAGVERKLIGEIRTRRMRFLGHVIRKDGLENLALTGKIEGKTGRGRKQTLWMTSPDLPTIPLLAENVRFFVTFPPFRFLT